MSTKLVLLLLAAFLLVFFPVYILQVSGRLILLVVFASWLLSRIPRRFILIRPERNVIRCLFHEKNEVRIIITNPSFLPIAVAAVRDETGGLSVDGSALDVVHLPPRGQAVLSYSVWSTTRGMYRLGPIHISGSDPIGLFPWDLHISIPRLAFVYPRIAPIFFHSHHGLAGGPIRSHHPMFLDTTQVRSIRPYETGDDPRHIHWKASAKSGQLMITEFAKSLTVPFYVILNLDEHDYHAKRKSSHIERCIEAATAFIDQATREQFSIGFACNGIIPIEAREPLFAPAEDQGGLHSPIAPAMANASQLLSILSVITSRTATSKDSHSLVNLFESLQFQLSPRILIISPPLEDDTFRYIVASVPRSCRMDFWFLDEHQDRQGRVDHRSTPPASGIHLRKLPEYGDELISPEAGHA